MSFTDLLANGERGRNIESPFSYDSTGRIGELCGNRTSSVHYGECYGNVSPLLPMGLSMYSHIELPYDQSLTMECRKTGPV